ncbi:MAG TPA: DUF1697 domain-containing protein [Solirubrobacteraceae bacterium]|jgi:uncharacterized protein (DUF1697 family)|nr:DUF1697 domain-containing protein [Solirubrobacteraceae bacterium]
MPSYAAFLRGMNVGGHRLTNDELRAHLEAMGFAEVATFRASGNVVIAADERTPGDVAEHLEGGLEAALGYAVPTFVRSAEQVLAIAAAQPFAPELLESSAGKLQVGLLTGAPSPSVREQALELAGDSDELAFDGSELYWLPAGGVLDSGLDMTVLARLFGAMTIRTHGTISQLAAKHFA